MSTTRPIHRRRGFTVAELLVVIGIIALLLAITVPATNQIIESSIRARAENAMQNALRSARDAAVRSPSGDAAAVFFYDRNQGVVVVTCQEVGAFNDDGTQRSVFVPLDTYEPVTIPNPWAVRGYAIAGSLSGGWYNDLTAYTGTVADDGHWVFPFNDFYDRLNESNNEPEGGWGVVRDTFMVRFRQGDGTLVRGVAPALVVDPSPVSEPRPNAGNGSPFQVTEAENLRRWAERVLFDGALDNVARSELLGVQSFDTVLAGPVSELALYNKQEMAAALQLRGLNRLTRSIYRDVDNDRDRNPIEPEFDAALAVGNVPSDADVSRRVTDWIQAQAGESGGVSLDELGEAARATARIFVVNPYSGQLIEVQP